MWKQVMKLALNAHCHHDVYLIPTARLRVMFAFPMIVPPARVGVISPPLAFQIWPQKAPISRGSG